MRAIIKCDTKIEVEELDGLLAQCGWSPALAQDDQIVKARTQEIIQHISEEDKPLAEKTLKYTVYDETTRTWGIVSAPAKHVLTFRLKNPVSERLKAACEKLVADLARTAPDNSAKGGTWSIKFYSRIEVLEPNSEDHAFSGEILPPKRLWLAIIERKTEAYIGLFTALVAMLLLLVTSPWIAGHIFPDSTSAWRTWLAGNLERFTTAAAVTMTISWFQVLLHWLDIQRQAYVRWMLD